METVGVKEVLKDLELPYFVLSTDSKTKIEGVLRKAGLNSFFTEEQIFSESMSFPDAAKAIGLEPSECAVVDHGKIGMELAKKGDFWIFGKSEGAIKDEFENKGIFMFNEFNELRELIDLFNSEVDLETKKTF